MNPFQMQINSLESRVAQLAKSIENVIAGFALFSDGFAELSARVENLEVAMFAALEKMDEDLSEPKAAVEALREELFALMGIVDACHQFSPTIEGGV